MVKVAGRKRQALGSRPAQGLKFTCHPGKPRQRLVRDLSASGEQEIPDSGFAASGMTNSLRASRGYPHNRSEAIRAPSTSDSSFFQAIVGQTFG